MKTNWKKIGENKAIVGLFFATIVSVFLIFFSGSSHVRPDGTYSVFYDEPTFLETLARRAVDARFLTFRDGSKADTSIVFIDITENSIRAMAEAWGRWPWPRGVYGNLLTYLTMGDRPPKAVAFDILFQDPSRSEVSQQQTIPLSDGLMDVEDMILSGASREDLQSKLTELQMLVENLVNVQDYLFANGIRGRNVVLSMLFQSESSNSIFTEDYLRERREGDLSVIEPFGRALALNEVEFPEVLDVSPPIPILSENALDLGHINFTPDADGPCRRAIPYIRRGEFYYPTLGLSVAQQVLGIPDDEIWVEEGYIRFGSERRIPLSADGTIQLNYMGSYSRTYQMIDVLEVLKSLQTTVDNMRYGTNDPVAFPPEFFSGKIVFIAASAPGLLDLRATPFEAIAPGVFVHCTLTDNILNDNFLVKTSRAFNVMTFIILAVFVGLVTARISPVRGAILALGLVLLYNAVALTSFNHGYILPMVVPTLSILLTYLGVVIFNYIKEEARRKWVQDAFGHYLSASVLQEILKDPDKLAFGGQRRNVTALFSDVAGFTSLSEKLPPEEVTHVLCEYLNHMVDCVYLTEGTLDKFIGDAVVAEWNTPLEQPDHPARACECALMMQDKITELQTKWDAEGKPKLVVRIGIHSGEMVVGNLGSSQVFDYTAIGDNMNTAARLEPLNKDFGTRIMVSGYTRAGAGGKFVFRDLGKVKLKGREAADPLQIYELIGRKGQVDSKFMELLEIYDYGLAHYYMREWDQAVEKFNEVLRLRPQDGVCQALVQIIGALKKRDDEGALPPDWSGYYEQKTK